MIEHEGLDNKAAAFVWYGGSYSNIGTRVTDSNGEVHRILDRKGGRRLWGIWDALMGAVYYEIQRENAYEGRVTLDEARDTLTRIVLGDRYDEDRGVSKSEMGAYIEEADSFPELFRRVNGF